MILPVGETSFSNALRMGADVCCKPKPGIIHGLGGAQEFMSLPVGATSFSEALRMEAEVYHNLKPGIIHELGGAQEFMSCQLARRRYARRCAWKRRCTTTSSLASSVDWAPRRSS